ncbi:MAG: hypothetical protein H7Y43_09575 [Akkermansiaceae bacterium]|nr:hypothetical protein [Verrucomicrobiales bacterium]
MKQHSKLSSKEQQQHLTESQSEQATAREFATAEELLRYDAAQIPVPPAIAQRLVKSAAGLPQPNRPWWKKLFGN